MKHSDQVIYLDATWSQLENWLSVKTYSNYFILCDENTYNNCFPILNAKKVFNKAEVICIKAGEEHKTIDSVEQICSKMLEKGIDRNSLCVALGGGMVCDLMGFCASVILRGVDCIYIPTSLLAMADASIGGKTGINFYGWKNQLGTFLEPKLVAIDTKFLDTLDDRNLRNGFVEMLKHSLLIGLEEFDSIKQLNVEKNDEILLERIKKSIEFKSKIVIEDFKENSTRKSLNLGHTLGHAIESLMLEKGIDVLHGEAIALGLVYELRMAGLLYYNRVDYFNEVIDFLKNYKADYNFNSDEKAKLIDYLQGDKKRNKNKILFSLLYKVGDCKLDVEVPMEVLLHVLNDDSL